ncbi:MAG: respiratory nitrate reductase subunit gamma [Candidatus Hydrothermarchaeaceae archaeon]
MVLVVFVGKVLPYITVLVFAMGWVYRFSSWANSRPSRKITLYPVPRTALGTSANILKRALVFPALYTADKFLWFAAVLFLMGLFISVALHAFINYPLTTLLPNSLGLRDLWSILGVAAVTREGISHWLGILSAVLVIVTVSFFLIRRLAIPEVRYLSTFQDYASLIYLLVIVSIGTYMRLFEIVDHGHLKAYLASLASLDPVAPPGNTIFLIHLTLAQFYLMYLPFSKAVHSMGTLMIQKMEQWR